jgi:hypothetical protein
MRGARLLEVEVSAAEILHTVARRMGLIRSDGEPCLLDEGIAVDTHVDPAPAPNRDAALAVAPKSSVQRHQQAGLVVTDIERLRVRGYRLNVGDWQGCIRLHAIVDRSF